MVFQLMFAGITVALISGAIAERMKFGAFILFAVLWATFIYSPLAHWVWGGGWLMELGALDFAGGTVVHISSGVAALAAALVLGKRHGYGKEKMAPHNLPFTLIGASLLWVGWFGFNAGSALAANGIAAGAFVATHVATAAGALAWLVVEWAYRGKPTALGAASGAVAGLVAITPAAGFVGPISAICIGIGGGAFCYLAVLWKSKLGFDDALDVLAIHGIGGSWGAIATGLFASVGGATGLFFGNSGQVVIQFIGVGATWVFSFVGTFIILKVLDMTIGLRVTKEDEIIGLDITQHSERAYT
jgi:Amt family ammonium transporter